MKPYSARELKALRLLAVARIEKGEKLVAKLDEEVVNLLEQVDQKKAHRVIVQSELEHAKTVLRLLATLGAR